MSDASWTEGAAPYEAQPEDYLELLKPRVMRLVIFTAAVGMLAAPVPVHPVIIVATVLCIAIGAGASGALNMWWDADIDAVMGRTQSRPIPSGRVTRDEALAIGVTLSVGSVVMLGLFGNILAGALLAFTIFFYAVIYSMWLKRATPQNIVIGGAAGAFPPMIGWAVATGGVSAESVLMFALIFLWTPPHFWALALFRNDDYTRAGVPMMPVVAGEVSTRRQMFLYTLLVAAVAIVTGVSTIGGPVYMAAAIGLNAVFIAGAWKLMHRREAEALADAYKPEKRFFLFSIWYLFLHFVLILIETGLRTAELTPAWWPVVEMF